MNKNDIDLEKGSKLITKLLARLFNQEITNIEKMPGSRNNTFRVQTKTRGNMIVRLSMQEGKVETFRKERWCVQKALEQDIPTPSILAVGDSIIPYAYSVRSEAEGIVATDWGGDKSDVWEELGYYVRRINSIDTLGFGEHFNWKSKHDTGFQTWREYLLGYDISIDRAVDTYRHKLNISKESAQLLENYVQKLQGWMVFPKLANYDITLQNVLVDQDGVITSILDWEMARSLPAPYGDFSNVYLDLITEEQKEYRKAFLRGYGYSLHDFEKIREEVEAYIAIRYANRIGSLSQDEDSDSQLIERIGLLSIFN